ncbi:MAG TPA: hypothetical protein VGW38_20625 [Chloroflexota bacterium]|nr:hypothetical protein [Chloroflexota bacterium]
MSDTATFHRIEEQTGIEVSGARHEDGVITISMALMVQKAPCS